MSIILIQWVNDSGLILLNRFSRYSAPCTLKGDLRHLKRLMYNVALNIAGDDNLLAGYFIYRLTDRWPRQIH